MDVQDVRPAIIAEAEHRSRHPLAVAHALAHLVIDRDVQLLGAGGLAHSLVSRIGKRP